MVQNVITWYLYQTKEGVRELVIRYDRRSTEKSIGKKARQILRSLGVKRPILGMPNITETLFPPKWEVFKRSMVFVIDYEIMTQKNTPSPEILAMG